MCIRKRSNLVAVGFLLVASGTGFAQQPSIEGAYRGSIVCEHLAGTLGMLRAPFDMTVSGTTVVAGRPIFNRDGSRVVGTEIATGTVSADGTLHLGSSWAAAVASFKGTYNGTLNATGGTITGTEAWTRSPAHGGSVSRACYGAYVRAPALGAH
ncbi:MAG: hypothetical protein WBF58_13955 [Xanthobacteraceae bacterium]